MSTGKPARMSSALTSSAEKQYYKFFFLISRYVGVEGGPVII